MGGAHSPLETDCLQQLEQVSDANAGQCWTAGHNTVQEDDSVQSRMILQIITAVS